MGIMVLKVVIVTHQLMIEGFPQSLWDGKNDGRGKQYSSSG